jgi:CHAT domain-containing protein
MLYPIAMLLSTPLRLSVASALCCLFFLVPGYSSAQSDPVQPIIQALGRGNSKTAESALQRLDKSAKDSSSRTDAAYWRLPVLALQGRWREAIQQQATLLPTLNPSRRSALMYYCSAVGEYARAIRLQTEIVSSATELRKADALLVRARLNAQVGNWLATAADAASARAIAGTYQGAKGASAQDLERDQIALAAQAWLGIAAAEQAQLTRADSILTPLLSPPKGSDDRLAKAFARLPDYPRALSAWAVREELSGQPALARERYERAQRALASRYGKRSPQALTALAEQVRLANSEGSLRDARALSSSLDRAIAKLARPTADGVPGKKHEPTTAEASLIAAELAATTDNPIKARRLIKLGLLAQGLKADTATYLTARAYQLYAEADLRDGRLTNAEAFNSEALRMLDSLVGVQGLIHTQAVARASRIAGGLYKFKEAEASAESALDRSAAQRAPRHLEHIGWLADQASLYARQAKFDLGQEVLSDVLALRTQVHGERSLEVGRAADALGKLQYDAGQYDPATKTLERALNTMRDLPKPAPITEATILDHLATLWQARGDYPKAEGYTLSAMKLRRRNLRNEPGLNIGSVTQLAELYQTLGRYSDALKLLQQATQSYARAGRTDDDATAAQSSLASLYARLGQYQEAETTARKARESIRKNWDEASLNVASSNLLLARVITEMGRYKEARTLLDLGYATYQAKYGLSNINTAKVTAQLALNDFYQNQPEAALAKLRDALAQTEASVGRQHIEYASQLFLLAQLNIALRRYPVADSLITEGLLLQGKLLGTRHPDYLRTEAVQANLFTLIGDYKQADVVYTMVLRKWRSVLSERHPEYAFLLADYAHLQSLRGSLSKARTQYDKVNTLLLAQVNRYFPALSEAEKADYWAKISSKLDRYYAFVITQQAKDPRLLGAAYDLRLQTKAMLLSQAAAIRSRIMASQNEELINLYESWQAKREYLAKLYTLTKAELKVTRVDVGDVEGEVNSLERELSEKSAAFAARTSRKQPRWTDVRAALAANEAAVEIIRISINRGERADSVVYAGLVVTGSSLKSPRLAVLPNGNQLERRQLVSYSRALSNRVVDTSSFRAYWAPIEAQLEGRTTVFLSTDGLYNQVSLASLRRPAGGYVLDRFDLRYISNTRDLLTRVDRSSFDGRTALLIGNPDYNENLTAGSFRIPELNGTQSEVSAIDSMMLSTGWKTEQLSGAEATETHLKALSNPKLLHIATHGFFYPVTEGSEASVLGIDGARAAQNPLLRSGLFLAGAGESLSEERTSAFMSTGLADNGIITAYEVMNLNLDNTELVVLSACETGLGEVRNGEGVYGLQRAFSVAGARLIIMSLWRVNDEVTQELITQFYRYWVVNKQDPRKAFRAAQEYVRARYEQPYFWGAFVMVGA